jgi:VWFA-related protein
VQPRTPTAIFGLNEHLSMLQGFTSDPEVLWKVITGSKGKGSRVLSDPTGGGGVQNSTSDNLEDQDVDPTVVANVRQFEQTSQSFQLQLRAKYTLDAMNQLARYLAAIPGRKNLIWFSGSFPVNVLPDMDGTLPDPFSTMTNSEEEFRETVTMLSASQVAVYPVDARGLFNSSPMVNVETTRNYSGPRGPARMQQDQSKSLTDTAAEQSTMRDMAAATGGRAFLNTNGLAAAVASAIDEGSNFYTLSYTPANASEDGKLRKIKVRVNQPGVNLAYRQGYYADRPGSSDKLARRLQASAISGKEMTTDDALVLSMMRGAPVPTEITMNIGAVPITTAGQTEDQLAAGNHAVGKMEAPFRRYSINYEVNPGNLNFLRMPDGKVHADVDLILFVYTAAGELINAAEGQVHLAAPLEEIKKAVAQGMIWHEEISTPAKGEYFLRIAVRDEHTDKFGAVEVASSQLKPVAQQTSVQPGPSAPAK